MIIDEKDLNSIDLSELGHLIPELGFRGYFLDSPGKEHYKLLAYFSSLYNNSVMLDIGTYKGCSSLALSYNSSNTIYSYDLNPHLRNVTPPDNVTYIVDNIINGKHDGIINSSVFILLDTDHNGGFERDFYQYILDLKWKGILMLDDIHLNQPMKQFWESIKEEKHNVSSIGHHSGTGLVIFR